MISKSEFNYIILKVKTDLKKISIENDICNSELCLDVAILYLSVYIPYLYKFPDIKNMLEEFIVYDRHHIDTIYEEYIKRIQL